MVSVADPVLTDDTLNDVDNHNNTDNDMSKDENEEQNLHATSNTDDVFVAAAGIPFFTHLNTDSSTDDVCTEQMEENPKETPILFSDQYSFLSNRA